MTSELPIHNQEREGPAKSSYFAMRQTLRRSCTACAKYKHSCDLGTPRCSRCIKRRVECHYANAPLTAPLTPVRGPPSIDASFAALDPFDSYPVTRLPRKHVQRLIYNCGCATSTYHQVLSIDSRSPS